MLLDRIKRWFRPVASAPLLAMQRLHIEPGDAIVVMTEGRLTRERAERIGHEIRTKFPGHEVIVLGDGMTIGTIGSTRR